MFIFTSDQRLHVASKLYEHCRRFISLTESSVLFFVVSFCEEISNYSDKQNAKVAQRRAPSFANPKKKRLFSISKQVAG